MRYLLTAFSALVAAGVGWALTAFLASTMISRASGGDREGANAMGAIFFIGPIGAVFALGVTAFFVWRYTANPEHNMAVGIGATVGLIGLIVAVQIALAPTTVEYGYLPPHLRGEAQFEIRIATARLPGGPNSAHMDLRRGGETLTVDTTRNQARAEGAATILPCAFPLRDSQTGWVFAVMVNDKQLGAESVDLVQEPQETTPWTDWKPMPGDLEYRFRTAILPKKK